MVPTLISSLCSPLKIRDTIKCKRAAELSLLLLSPISHWLPGLLKDPEDVRRLFPVSLFFVLPVPKGTVANKLTKKWGYCVLGFIVRHKHPWFTVKLFAVENRRVGCLNFRCFGSKSTERNLEIFVFARAFCWYSSVNVKFNYYDKSSKTKFNQSNIVAVRWCSIGAFMNILFLIKHTRLQSTSRDNYKS